MRTRYQENRIDKLPGTAIGISANFTRLACCRDSSNMDRNPGDSHAICTWIDDDGGLRCTCLGHSRFQDLRSKVFKPYCSHTHAFCSFVQHVFDLASEDTESMRKAFVQFVLESDADLGSFHSNATSNVTKMH